MHNIKPIRILYDNKFGNLIAAGIGVYIREVLKQMKHDSDIDLIPLYSEKNIKSYKPKNIIKKIGSNLWELIRVQILLPFLCWKYRANWLFCPFQQIPWIKVCPTILTIYDFVYLKYPEWEQKWWFMRLVLPISIRRADIVLSISNQTKQDAIDLFGINEKKITTNYLGIKYQEIHSSLQIENEFQIKSKYHLPKKYLLMVGTLSRRKNIEVVIRALSLCSEDFLQPLRLVIVGAIGWKTDQLEYWKQQCPSINEKIDFLGFIPDEDLQVIYKNAECFIFPSLYEGFGFPILEAMIHHCPVICAENSSLTEVAQNAVLYFDPNDPQDLKNKLLKLLNDPNLKEELIQKGIQNTKKFTWDQHIQNLKKIIYQYDTK